ncbi:energy-coupling factor transporter transmembrane protein EcfT [Cetobacterium sp. 2A]|uniref:energy-coupling factor transporter transmembrane component T family protein n=1 Tax=unclassified Cetobacterium TaxID=2630983 RepID=UPI00163CB041|nr:energy-coupling factor transporter transmembrane component T [Cetobacterium sp. 2A]MBC2854934.1 energy-coupling factor transporter transmembrane protein EcfT [Cetobacterium sp. 2A]
MLKKYDPRTIFLSTIFIIIALVLMKTPLEMLLCGILVSVQIYIFKIDIKNLKRILSYSIGLFISIIFVNYFFMGKSETEILLSLGRVLGIIMLSVSVLSSMEISDIGYSIEKIFKPLKYFKIPVESIGTIIAISLKFIPLIEEESKRILKAQKARGIDYDIMKISERIKNIPTLFLPVVISGIQHSINLATAMEVRGYGAPYKKTRLNESKISFIEYSYLIFILIFIFVLGVIK